MSSPRNTSKADPVENFLTAMGGIEAQEAQGQREMVASSVLPFPNWQSSDAAFEELGFKFGDKIAGDDLFRQATLPAGWTKVGSDHAMWSYVADERGINRVGIFYKAAFYDRRADMHIINVGNQVAQDWIFGDAEELTLSPALTADELASAERSARGYLEQADEHPAIYGDRLPRAEAFLKRIAEVQS